MKRLFILILFSATLFSKEIILKKKIKETNNTILTEQILIKTWLINTLNSITPDFLNVSPNDSIFKLKIKYNSQNQKLQTSLNAKIIFPSIEKKTSKIKINKKNIFTRTITLKFTPLILLYRKKITPTLKIFSSLKNDYLLKYIEIAETIYYYSIFNDIKEITTITINRLIKLDNLKLKASKTYLSREKSNLFYVFGIYYYNQPTKLLRIYGIELSGERKKLPFIYNYKIFFDYRYSLFNKKFIFLEATPYIFFSKEHHYNIKEAIELSFNIKF